MSSSHRPALVSWFTGLSGAGKSTLARLAALALEAKGRRVRIVDGDDLRATVARGLGYSMADVVKSNEIALRVCAEEQHGCDVLLVTRISPLREERQKARVFFGEDFFEVYVKASFQTVMRRDAKGLYAKARQVGSPPMIGTSEGAPYEAPERAELVLDTDVEEEGMLAAALTRYVEGRLLLRGVD